MNCFTRRPQSWDALDAEPSSPPLLFRLLPSEKIELCVDFTSQTYMQHVSHHYPCIIAPNLIGKDQETTVYISAVCMKGVNHLGCFFCFVFYRSLERFFFCSYNQNSIIELFGSVCRDSVISTDGVLRVS